MPATALLTSEQYLSLPEEFDQNGNRIKDELIGGEVVKMPPSFELHNVVRGNIVQALIEYMLSNRRLGLNVFAELAYVVSKHDTLVPDGSVVRTDRLSPRKQKYTPGAPDLAIEVVSPSDKASHLNAKVDAYLKGGSKTVWVVYPDTRSLMIFSGDTVRDLRGEQLIDDLLLPGFSAPVSAFFNLT
jgi:Uma2 family endonuclease